MEHRPEFEEFGVKWRAANKAVNTLCDLYRYAIEKHTITEDKETLDAAVETLMDYIETVKYQVNMAWNDKWNAGKSLSER